MFFIGSIESLYFFDVGVGVEGVVVCGVEYYEVYFFYFCGFFE